MLAVGGESGVLSLRLFLLAAIAMLPLLTACQSKSENDPPFVKPYECPQHTLDTGTCGK
jgi:hypothetical protein